MTRNTNQSFLTERTQSDIQPGTEEYTQWQNHIENKFKQQDVTKNQPTINERSKQIMEQKRIAMGAQGTVHSRLHEQARSKQKRQ